MDKLLLTPEEAAEVLGIGRSKVYQLFSAGQLASVKIGGSRRVPVEALREYVSSLCVGAAWWPSGVATVRARSINEPVTVGGCQRWTSA